MHFLFKEFRDLMSRIVNRDRHLPDGDPSIDPAYRLWISRNEPKRAQLKIMKTDWLSWGYRPGFSLIIAVERHDLDSAIQSIQSVLAQIYGHWELWCLVDGESGRIDIEKRNREISKAGNKMNYLFYPAGQVDKIESLNAALKYVRGDYVVFVDPKVRLSPCALYEAARDLNVFRDSDLLYSDEDRVSVYDGRRFNPDFKPDWSPDTFHSRNYLGHFAVLRKTLIDKVGGFRAGYDCARDYDLLLRVVQNTSRIRHIPKVLCHSEGTQGPSTSDFSAQPDAVDAVKKAIQDHLRESGTEARVVEGMSPASFRVQYKIEGKPKVSIIIPTRDKVSLLKQCVNSIFDKTDYPNYEILVIDNESREEKTLDYLGAIEKDSRVKTRRYAAPFNFAAINNFAAGSTDADYLLFLNNDTEVISREWLSAMLEFAQRDDVGAVGAKLLYPDGKIQHSGVILGIGGVANHAHLNFPRESHGYFGRINLIQNVSIVTGACMMVRRSVFEEVGGFDESLSHAFNDVDLCLKIRDKGYLIVYTPYAELYHHESASRGYEDTPEKQARFWREVAIVQSRWKSVLEKGDPYYNPNLTLEKCDFSIRS